MEEPEDQKTLRQEVAVGLEAAERGEFVPLDIEATIAEGKRLLAEKHLDTLLQKGLDSGPATPLTAQNWQDIRAQIRLAGRIQL